MPTPARLNELWARGVRGDGMRGNREGSEGDAGRPKLNGRTGLLAAKGGKFPLGA